MGPNTNRCVTRTPVRIRITSGYDLGPLSVPMVSPGGHFLNNSASTEHNVFLK